MSYVLNLQATQVAKESSENAPESFLTSGISPITCFSTTSIAFC